MREDLGYRVKDVSDHEHRELSVKEVLGVFENSYLNHTQPLNVPDAHFIQNSDGSITANVVVTSGGSTVKCTATGQWPPGCRCHGHRAADRDALYARTLQ